jgi:hypothetical protein
MAAIDIRLEGITKEQARLQEQLQRSREDAEKAAASVTGLPGQIAATERSLASTEAELADVLEELAGVGRGWIGEPLPRSTVSSACSPNLPRLPINSAC